MSKRDIFGVQIGESVCICYGEVPDMKNIVKPSELTYKAESMSYGVAFAANYQKFIYIAKHRDYSKRAYVYFKNDRLMLSSEMVEGSVLLRPDTIEGIVQNMLSNIVGYRTFVVIDGDVYLADENGLTMALCNYWNNDF